MPVNMPNWKAPPTKIRRWVGGQGGVFEQLVETELEDESANDHAPEEEEEIGERDFPGEQQGRERSARAAGLSATRQSSHAPLKMSESSKAMAIWAGSSDMADQCGGFLSGAQACEG